MSEPFFPAGRIVGGRYTVRAMLAHRTGGATYGALAAPNREVVLKMVAGDPAEAVRRMNAATAAVGERRTVPLVDSGQDEESGDWYLVTELCAWPSLTQLVQVCPLKSEEVVVLTRNVARALDEAHARGVAHLALKPSNVFVGPAPELAVRLADFGAGALRAEAISDDRLAVASPWLAPEQAAAGEEAAGMSADVHALALLAFFALTGRVYRRATAGDASDAGPVSMRARDVADVPLGPEIDAAFAKALSTAPGERFAKAIDLAEALARGLGLPATSVVAMPAALPVRAPTPVPPPPASRPILIPSFARIHSSAPSPSLAEPAGDAPAPVAIAIAPAAAPRIEPKVEPVASAPAVAISAHRPPRAAPREVRAPSAVGTRKGRAIVVGSVVAASSLVLVIAGVLALRSGAGSSEPAPSSTIAASPARASAVPAAPPPPVDTPPAIAPAPPPAPTAAAPAASAAHAPPVTPPANDRDAHLLVVCTPQCERVFLNGKRMTSFPEAATLPPGSYGIGVGRSGYGGQYRQLKLRVGQRETVSFILNPLRGGK